MPCIEWLTINQDSLFLCYILIYLLQILYALLSFNHHQIWFHNDICVMHSVQPEINEWQKETFDRMSSAYATNNWSVYELYCPKY